MDAVILLVLFLAGYLFFSSIEAFELLVEFMESHEDWELDELFTAATLVGISGFIYAVRRYREARAELIKRQSAEANVTWLAQNDPLTRLPNRRFLHSFQERFDADRSAMGSAKHYAVFSVDLDGFKRVNDLHGHFSGDLLLQVVAQRLTDAAPDDLIVRLGGDEFLVVAEVDDEAEASSLACKLSSVICEPIILDGVHAEVGCSIGYVAIPGQANTIEEAARCADIAMYAAKKKGNNAVVPFHEDMGEEAARRAKLEKQLRAAVRAGDIVPHYQPLVNLESDEVCGFEVLARWTLPDGSSIPPSTFIPVAEQTGLITELSESLLDRACKDAKSWPDTMIMSFNLSPTQLTDRLVGLRIMGILSNNGILPHRLEVEITESAMIQDGETALDILNDLRAAGIRAALDDFGTGYSSLSQIAKFNFNRIKIDRSFVSEFEENAKQRSIVKAIIALGEGLDISTTAEGVETDSQLESLKALGCGCGQGYLLGRPMSAGEATDFIAEHAEGSQLKAQNVA